MKCAYEVISIDDYQFFDTFDEEYRNKIFRSRFNRFERTTLNTALSIKAPFNFEEHYYIGNQRFVIPGGHYHVFNPKNELHCSLPRSPKPADSISIFFNDKLMSEVFFEMQQKELNLSPIDYSQLVLPGFFEKTIPMKADELGRILAGLRYKEESIFESELFFYALAEQLLLSQMPHLKRIANISATKPATRIELYRRLDLACDYIHDHIESNIRIGELARMCWMSEFNFMRQFRATYQQSPYQYILEQKMLRAKSLLKKEKLTVGEVAHRLGFADTSSFGKCFRKKTGMTPSEYLNQ